MPIITLTTDLGNTDHYVGAIKASILRQMEQVNIVDISHQIHTFDIAHAAFVLKHVYKDFPPKSIHIIGVNGVSEHDNNHLVVFADDHYFIAADNGIFSLLLDVKADKIVKITQPMDTDFNTFPTKDSFVKAACHLARGGTMELIGSIVDDFSEKRSKLTPLFEKNSIRGSIMHIDHYGNAISNIDKRLFTEVAKNRRFSIHFGRREHYELTKLMQTFNQVPLGEALALFSSSGHLTISMNMGKAASLMGLELNDTIRIEFYD